MKFTVIILEHDLGHLKFTRKKKEKQTHVQFGLMYKANNKISNLLSWIPPSTTKKQKKIWPEITLKMLNQHKISRLFAFLEFNLIYGFNIFLRIRAIFYINLHCITRVQVVEKF